MSRPPTGLLFFACLLLAPACATPIGVVRGGTEEVHRELTANVLSAGRPSEWSGVASAFRIVLPATADGEAP
jgi:hypothetical protein